MASDPWPPRCDNQEQDREQRTKSRHALRGAERRQTPFRRPALLRRMRHQEYFRRRRTREHARFGRLAARRAPLGAADGSDPRMRGAMA